MMAVFIFLLTICYTLCIMFDIQIGVKLEKNQKALHGFAVLLSRILTGIIYEVSPAERNLQSLKGYVIVYSSKLHELN